MEAVVEQMQQTYELQTSGYYSRLHLVEDYLLQEKELSLETEVTSIFFEAWEKESESTLLFLQEMVRRSLQTERKYEWTFQVSFCWI